MSKCEVCKTDELNIDLKARNLGANNDRDETLKGAAKKESNEVREDEFRNRMTFTAAPRGEQLTETASESEDEIDGDTICGIGSFRPQWLQKWATARSYVILYSIIGILQGAYFTSIITSLTTLEKRYAFSSKTSGMFMVTEEILGIFSPTLLGYISNRVHRPRVLFAGSFVSALSALVAALPYFLHGHTEHLVSLSNNNSTGTEYCDYALKIENCDADDKPPTLPAVFCVLSASFVKGFTGCVYFIIGVTYLDDSVKKKNTAIYLAIAMAFRLLGPIVGYLMSTAFLNLYENPFVDPGFDTDDPRWIGAWWLGFLTQGILLAIVSLPLLLFPRRLKRKSEKSRQRSKDNANVEGETLKQAFFGLFRAIKILAKQPFYVLLTVGTIFSMLSAFAEHGMLPKYLESQFGFTSSKASLLSGPPAIVFSQIFIILGGVAVYKWKPSAKALVVGSGISEILSFLLFLALLIPSCERLRLPDEVKLENDCNENCMCTTRVFAPICDPKTQLTYFSPCFAGCTISVLPDGEKVFSNCSCIEEENTAETVEGICKEETCWPQAIIYITILVIMGAISSIFRVAHAILLFRSVAPKDKSTAIGVFDSLLGLLAFLPAPIIYTSIVDSTCLIWEESCGETGNCWIYDVQSFKISFHSVSACFCLLSACCYAAMYRYCNKVTNLYEEEDE